MAQRAMNGNEQVKIHPKGGENEYEYPPISKILDVRMNENFPNLENELEILLENFGNIVEVVVSYGKAS